MTNRTIWSEFVIVMLLGVLASLGLRQLSAAPYPQGTKTGKQNGREQDKLLTGPPFSLEQILTMVHVHPERLSNAITNRGLSFEASPENLNQLRKGGFPEKMIDLIRRKAPYKPSINPPPKLPAFGNLLVKCSPAECNISIDGKPWGATTNGTLEIKGLPPKEVVVDFAKEGYIGLQKTITVLQSADVSSEVALEPSDAIKAQFGSELLSTTIQALGGDAGLAGVAAFYGSGAAVVWNKDGQRSDWTFNTLVKLPNMVQFDLEGSSGKFWISLIGDKYKSGGDRNKLVGVFGASGTDKNRTGEFDTSLRVYRDFQVSALLKRIRGNGFSVLSASRDADQKGEFHLRATGSTETYDITLGTDKLPIHMKYESELGLGTGMEVVYADYKDVGNGKYPSTTEIKLADGPHHGIEIKLEHVTLVADLQEKDFNGRYKPKK